MSADGDEIIGRYTEVRGTRTYYEACGVGVPFICVHTAGTDGRLYRHTLPALAAHGFRMIAVDLPGHGKSFPIDWTPIDDLHVFSEWVMEFAGELGLDQPIVMGCSIGGDIAVDLAAHHSGELRACIALEGAAHTPTFVGAGTLLEPHTISWESIAEAMAPTVILPGATPDQLQEIVWLHKSTTQRVYASDLVGWERQDVRDRLGDVTLPLMVGLGTGDYFLPEDIVTATVDAVPSATLVRFENLGHYPMWEDPALVNGAILDFLDGHGLLPQRVAPPG
jgi:pimeloyl-ACP methyl ester carboxylesterase